MRLTCTIPGPPVPWQRPRPRQGRRGYVTPAKSQAYQRHVRGCVQASLLAHRMRWPIDRRYDVTLSIFFQDRRVRDDDNVEKNIKDALDGTLWDGDTWTRFRRVEKTMHLDRDAPRVELVVEVV